MEFYLLVIVIGFIVGGFIGMTGMGGGALMTPILITILKIEPIIAIGSDIIYAALTKVAGSYQHIKQKTVDFKLVKNLAKGSVPGAILGGLLSYYLTAQGINIDSFIKSFLGGALIVVALTLIMSLIFKAHSYKKKLHDVLHLDRHLVLYTVLTGLLGGFLVGLTSVGSGTVMMALILIIYNTSLRKVIGSDIVHATILLFTAGITHFFIGHVDWMLVLFLLIGSIPGVIIGSKLAKRAPKKVIKSVLIVLLLFFGVRLFLT